MSRDWALGKAQGPGVQYQESPCLRVEGQGQALLPLGLTINRDAEARCPSPATQTNSVQGRGREAMPEEIHIGGNVIP